VFHNYQYQSFENLNTSPKSGAVTGTDRQPVIHGTHMAHSTSQHVFRTAVEDVLLKTSAVGETRALRSIASPCGLHFHSEDGSGIFRRNISFSKGYTISYSNVT
jgi:hypothetical protein